METENKQLEANEVNGITASKILEETTIITNNNVELEQEINQDSIGQVNNNSVEISVTSDDTLGTNNNVENDILNESSSNLQTITYQDMLKYLSILDKHDFICKNNALYRVDDRGKLKKISNFIPINVNKSILTNGADEEIKYKLKAVLIENFTELPEIEVSKEQYNSFKFIIGSQWDGYAIINGNNDIYLRQVSQVLAKETMQVEHIFTHTGFRKIGDKLCYLYHGGVIGDAKNVKANLSTDKLEQYDFTTEHFDTKEALNRGLSMLDVAKDRSITIPLIAAIYSSPLTSIFQEEMIYADYVMFFIGKSGTRKSSLAALALSHWGNNFQRNNFPCSFRDTINNLEKKSYILKDVLNVIDDLNPEFVGNYKIATFERILEMYADRVGRR